MNNFQLNLIFKIQLLSIALYHSREAEASSDMGMSTRQEYLESQKYD
jgi:hypothetical protein